MTDGSDDIHGRVRDAIASLPIHFRMETRISGVNATDLHTLNTVLGATIEEEVVRTLNHLRSSWDPDDRHALYSFVRQAQTFPDVLLRRPADGQILLGIELKGWYLLAKEREPSLRFQVTEAACAEHDLIVVVPWVLSDVIGGSPVVFEPFVTSAKDAARHRNQHWQGRNTSLDTTIHVPEGVSVYPSKADRIADKPASDAGGNFGRLARTGLMDDYIKQLDEERLCGIKTVFWRDFLRTFQDSTADEDAHAALAKLKSRVGEDNRASSVAGSALAIVNALETLLEAATDGRSG